MTRPEPGEVLARRYLLMERLASGGTSVIWRAFDQALQRTVAVKVLSTPLQAGAGGRDRVRDEAQVTARLVHPDVIDVYDYGEAVTSDGRVAAFVVMRLLDGVPLAERIVQGRLPWTEAALIARRIAAVLAAAHADGIVHRDVTAENVLLTPEGPKLLDFGIAALVGDPDDASGTPPYVSPERLKGAPAQPAVDVYAFGVLLFTMLTGHHPYPETTWEQFEAAVRTGPPPRPSGAPAAIASLCRRCLSDDPAGRPSASQIVDELRLSVVRSRWRLRSGLAAFTVGVLLVATVGWLQRADETPTRSRAQAPAVPTWSSPSASAGPTSSVSPFASPSVSPSVLPSVSPKASRSLPRRVAREDPMATARQAAEGFQAALQRENVDRDVAVDFTHLLDRATARQNGDPEALADLRDKLAARRQEGRISHALSNELLARLNEMAAAFSRA